jgi:hypothetical protein
MRTKNVRFPLMISVKLLNLIVVGGCPLHDENFPFSRGVFLLLGHHTRPMNWKVLSEVSVQISL